MKVSSNNQNIQFNGLTRSLKRNYYETSKEIFDVFQKYPNADGIAGSLPHSWLKNIVNLPKEEKSNIIKNIYKLFRETFENNYTQEQLPRISENFTQTLRKYGIIPQENQIIIKKRKLSGAVLRGAYTIKERGKNKTLAPLFIKKFINKNRISRYGILNELALGHHLNRLFRSERIIKPYFGDTIGHFIVSKYEITPQNIKIPRQLTISEVFDPETLSKFFEKIKNLTNDKTDFVKLLAKKGFVHNDLHDQNIIITKNSKGNLILKLIDLGLIEKCKQL